MVSDFRSSSSLLIGKTYQGHTMIEKLKPCPNVGGGGVAAITDNYDKIIEGSGIKRVMREIVFIPSYVSVFVFFTPAHSTHI